MNSYTFDHANRLAAVSDQQTAVSYAYNGLGDRIQQTADSVTTDYTLDLAAGLTQVLADGMNTYLYGIGRIAQFGISNTDYFLGDVLGSVRQLVDDGGSVTLAKSYVPYGEVMSSGGAALTNYGFTGEWTDSYIKFLYLRSRWYSPQTGRFTTRDVWQGDYNIPMSYNLWLYGYANPVRFIDPTGYYGSEVHHDLTLARAKFIASKFPIVDPDRIANLLADWNNAVDVIAALMPAGGCSSCHFMPWERTIQHVNEALNSGKPYLFGATLHQLQDYYSHWREGYHNQTWGHARHSLKERNGVLLLDFYDGGHWGENNRIVTWIESPYGVHPYNDVLNDVRHRNPQLMEIPEKGWKIIDLYLRLDGENVASSERYIMRDRFGFDTDLYVRGSRRETYMTRVLDEYLRKFFEQFSKDKCSDWTGWLDEENHALEIRSLLTK